MLNEKFPLKLVDAADLKTLFELIKAQGYEIVGPRLQDQTIVLESLDSFEQLPKGLIDDHQPGAYRTEATDNDFYFSYTIGPHSPKNFLHPPKRRLWTVEKKGDEWSFQGEAPPEKPFAFFGVRACDAAAILKMAQVFNKQEANSYFGSARKNSLIITATCLHPNQQCFCTSMEVGPQSRFSDIDLLELAINGRHRFVVRCESELGFEIVQKLPSQEDCDDKTRQVSQNLVDRASKKIAKKMPPVDIQKSLAKHHDHPRWQEVADRCLSCGNCTMVCPTCFCTTVTDVTELDGDHSERWLQWDSCFNEDFSFIHGGAMRPSVKSRYRQWLSHKLDHWHEQFGESGCVGCGRCTTWCPVGIDITEEVTALGAKT